MPRPRKWRRICELPQIDSFGPLVPAASQQEVVIMTVDEYETIRWIDVEGLLQEECAVRMNVARTTVQKIYNDARRKLGLALVKGRTLRIEGGEYRLCEEEEPVMQCGRCHRRRHGRYDESLD
ncbi:DUF134 domain-containing protein [uncultured Anaeromusa sp.]|uniref:DUF134 domain-containing protein n=1 Tax=uncultured Anaeromusa sp. TaxID=673273 RepID=UPI0029C7FC93|nr:DUF134 domain-containing protein [uncultured Anaeromusa sp.]